MHSSSLDKEKISSLYVALPRESRSSGGVPVAVRHLESLLRMAEAHARMHLRDLVRSDDVEAAIRQTLHSFVVAQKFAVRRALQRSFAKYLHSNQDKEHLLLHLLQELFRNEQMYQVIRLRQKGREAVGQLERLEVPLEELESRARERRIYDCSGFVQGKEFQGAGYALDAQRGVISRAFVAQDGGARGEAAVGAALEL